MRALIQRVAEAGVKSRGQGIATIKNGMLLFLCAVKGDTDKDIDYVIRKVLNLRIFEDPAGKMNLSITDVQGEILVVAQFTLAARTRKGNRPSFDDAELPDKAKEMYDTFIDRMKETGIPVRSGTFGAYMSVSLINDGPVTILIDSRE